MSDDLQKLIQEALTNRLDKDDFIQKFREALKKGGAAGLKLEDAHEYAQRRGEASSEALLDVIKPGVLPNDRMDFTTANQTVRPLLEENFNDVQDTANQVQKALDRAEGIGLNGVNADFPEDRAAGLIDKLTDSETIEELRKWLDEPIVNFSEAAFDQWVQANADFRYKAGMSPKIIRKGHFGMCPWCAALVGTYDYEEVRYGSDVFRRHKHCTCTVTYINGSTRQNVWSKKVWQASPEELEARKNLHREIVRLNPERLQNIAESSTKELDIAMEKTHNEQEDRKQWDDYRSLLGDAVPQTFEEFQTLKSQEPEKWALIELDYNRRRTLIEHPEMALPNAKEAVAPDAKFHAYIFNPENRKGWAKGQAFTSHLGYSIDNWTELQKEILSGAKRYVAQFKSDNAYGHLYEQAMILYGQFNNPANVIVGWIVKPDGNTSMTSAYIKGVKKDGN